MKTKSKQKIIREIVLFTVIFCCIFMFNTIYYGAGKDGLHQDTDGIWRYYENNVVNFQYEGLVQNEYGWWYVNDGQVDFTYDGIVDNAYGSWFLENGEVNFGINGLAQCGDGWYLFENGAVQTNATTLAHNEYGWWYVKNGQIDFSYHGLGTNEVGTWYINNGEVNFGINGLAQCGNGWYLFENGAVQTNTTTLAQNEYGLWYINNGQVDFSYTGTYIYQGTTYDIINGQATARTDSGCNLPVNDEYYKYEYAYKNGGNTSGFTTDEKAFYNGLAACLNSALEYSTPYEQEKAVHDYIVLNCAYDMRVVNGETISVFDDVFYAEGVFKNGVAVCDGYSKAFQLCMDILGIECIRVTGYGNGGGHAWNAVKLDGEWYMVDVTWDDPVPDTPGRVLYNYFNVTDAQMKRDHEYECEIQANGTKYNYYSMQENYVTNIDDYYAYVNKHLGVAAQGESVTVIVELDTPWTSELLNQYMDFSKLTETKNCRVDVNFSTYVAQYTWTRK